jgi:hypothetical protein
LLSPFSEYSFPECRYAEYYSTIIILLSVLVLYGVMLSVLALNVIILNAIMLSVFMLNVIMLNVQAPSIKLYLHEQIVVIKNARKSTEMLVRFVPWALRHHYKQPCLLLC